MTIKVQCETCDWVGRRRETTRTACPKCKGVDVWHVDREGFRVGRAGPVAATPLFEVNDLGRFRVYPMVEMLAFLVDPSGYMLGREEAARLGALLAAWGKKKPAHGSLSLTDAHQQPSISVY